MKTTNTNTNTNTKELTLQFVEIIECNLTKKSRKSLASLYLFYLEHNKPSEFILPLIVNEDGSSLTIEQFQIIFLSFERKVGKQFQTTLKKSTTTEGNNFYIVEIKESDKVERLTREPKVKEIKREASGKLARKAQEKKSEEQKKIEELEDKFNHKMLAAISSYVVSKFKVQSKDLPEIEGDLLKIIKNVK